MPDISVIIVNYNGAHFLAECLDALFESPLSLEVIVVDNASKDDSAAVLGSFQAKCGALLSVIWNDQNKGFGAANNQGAAVAKGDYLFLLNNDTKINPQTLPILWGFCKSQPRLGAASPKLCHADGSLQAQGSLLGHWQFKGDHPRKVSFIAGAAVMIKRRIYQEMNGFDENFFFYNEDIDLCKRLLKKGLEIYYVPGANLIHYGGLSTQSIKPTAVIEGYRGGLYVAYKHFPRWVYHVYRVVLLLDIGPKWLFYTLWGIRNKQKKNMSYIYKAIFLIDARQEILCKGGHPSRV